MKGLLKFITCGSVDDGKSTLIGHILYDSKLLYTDQEKALELDSKVGSREGAMDYSLLLDGLMAEREQGITIDVAYRYFTTEHRSFIVADTPGHEEYTRNMAVGASFADLAIILVDAKQGVLVQTRRHARICSLMGIRQFVFAVNKMDLMGYSKECFEKISKEIQSLSEELTLAKIKIIPISATEGDNLTLNSSHTPWYSGESLLTYLENVDIEDASELGFYFPVQRVCRPNHTFRGFQGQIEAGSVSVGDELMVLPSYEKAIVKSIHVTDREAEIAFKNQAVTLQLDKEVDVSRGCVLTKDAGLTTSKELTATLLWMDDSQLTQGKNFFVKIGTKLLPGVVTAIQYKIHVNTGEQQLADTLSKNEIASCNITLSEAIVIDKFQAHKTLGELILIDRITHMTSACGVVTNTVSVEEKIPFGSAFEYQGIEARGDIFEEFYYNLESLLVSKYKTVQHSYTVGDEIPLRGESYHYPENFDILVLRDKVAIHLRNKKIAEIKPLSEYRYLGYPITNGRGFAIKVKTAEDLAAFLTEYNQQSDGSDADFANKWLSFETYRRIIFHSNYWRI